MAWQQPKTNWDTHPKEIEPADLNRIEGNIEAVREQSNMALRLETVSSFPAHTPGRVIYHTGNKRAYVSDGAQWIPIGVEGDAVAANVLSGKKFSSLAAGVGITGTMPNRGAVIITPGTANQTILQGYHNGSGYVKGDSNLVAGNIRHEISVFGVNGRAIQCTVADENSPLRISADTESGKKTTGNGVIKRIRVNKTGVIRVFTEFRSKKSGWTYSIEFTTTNGKVYSGNPRDSTSTGNWTSHYAYLIVLAGAEVCLYVTGGDGTEPGGYVRNFRIYYDIQTSPVTTESVIQD